MRVAASARLLIRATKCPWGVANGKLQAQCRVRGACQEDMVMPDIVRPIAIRAENASLRASLTGFHSLDAWPVV